jgi:hypothetical protein
MSDFYPGIFFHQMLRILLVCHPLGKGYIINNDDLNFYLTFCIFIVIIFSKLLPSSHLCAFIQIHTAMGLEMDISGSFEERVAKSKCEHEAKVK